MPTSRIFDQQNGHTWGEKRWVGGEGMHGWCRVVVGQRLIHVIAAAAGVRQSPTQRANWGIGRLYIYEEPHAPGTRRGRGRSSCLLGTGARSTAGTRRRPFRAASTGLGSGRGLFREFTGVPVRGETGHERPSRCYPAGTRGDAGSCAGGRSACASKNTKTGEVQDL